MIFAPKRPKASWPVSICTYTLLVFAIIFSWQSQTPGEDAFSDNDGMLFSRERALNHLQHIAQKPHFTGSEQHLAVKEYLLAELTRLGLEVHVQEELGQGAWRNTSARVSNIVAKLPGTTGAGINKALALVSHYDSATYSSPGASDAGSGVVTILEALRAFIESGEQHNNDIVVIFTDAEEQGLLGAQAFVSHHPWAKDIGLILNFEARGSGGPSFMLLETNGGNSRLIEAFSNAGVAHPQANSLMYSIYKLLPNDTDLTVFREQRNINGFNFAFIDDHFDYHTELDTIERLDISTLNHQADYLTNLLPFFANQDLTALDSDQDDVFFNIADLMMVQYPFYLAWPLTIAAGVFLLILLSITTKQGLCSVKSVSVGALPAILSVVLSLLMGIVGWKLLLIFYPHYSDIRHNFPYNGHATLCAFVLFTIGICAALFRWFKNRYSYLNAPSLGIFPLLLWLIVNLFICVYLVGASFFIIPLLGSLIAFVHYALNKSKWRSFPFLLTLCALPGVIILAPQVPTFVIGLGMKNLFIATTLSCLMLLLLLPGLVFVRGSRWISRVCLLTGLGLLTYAHLNAGFTETNKKPTSINYLYDSADQRAFLFSYNRALDSFTQQFFDDENKNTGQLDNLYPNYRSTNIQFVKQTDVLPLDPASIQILSDQTIEGFRTVELQINPARQNNMLQLVTFSPLKLTNLSVSGQTFDSLDSMISKGTLLRHVVTDMKALNVSLTIAADQALKLRLLETRFDLPSQLPGFIPRAPEFMPEPFVYTDATIISQRINIPE